MVEINLTSNFSHMLTRKNTSGGQAYYINYGAIGTIADLANPTEAEMEMLYEATKEINNKIVNLIWSGSNLSFEYFDHSLVKHIPVSFARQTLSSGHKLIHIFSVESNDINLFIEGGNLYLGVPVGGN